MKSAGYAIIVTIFLWWLANETAGNNCIKDISWKDATYYHKLRIQGEWIKINCAIRTCENVTLWFGKNKGETTKKLEVDDKKIKLVSKNVFNITNLTTEDHGWYTCQVCGKRLEKFLEVPDQGKAYAKPIVVKNPNKALYEIEDNVKLRCHAEGITVAAYDIMWYKFEKLRSTGSYVNGMWTETLSLNELSERDEGTYKCKINRLQLQYSAKKLVNISVKDPLEPKIRMEEVNLQPNQGEDFSFSYNVSSYPESLIKWWRTKDRDEPYELITQCQPSADCKNLLGKQNISKTTFEIKDLKFPHDEFFYKCNATNNHGNDSKIFRLQVYVKPTISMDGAYIYKKGMIINCTLGKGVINPPQVKIMWYSCDKSKCDKKRVISESYSLRLESQSKTRAHYRCEAKNNAGSANKDIKVLMQSPNSTTQQTSPSNQKETMLSIVVPLAVTSMIILVAVSFVLHRRKKIYGGLYLFSYPPLPDYMAILDDNGNIQDQLEKLPFIPEWEFPRERITLVSQLGSGQFGMVWLAEGIGISAFRPRDILRERAGGRRFSSLFDRTAKRNSYIYCKEVTQVAVKTVKESHGPNDLADLQSELKILIHVGENKNIVNIRGACTKGKKSEIWVIMEYCPHGNLREFLRNSRSRYNVDENGLITDLSQIFGPKNLIHFSLEITKGMNFLISRKVIHRDLAARNILIGDGYVAKVGDFGLARDVYKCQEYIRKSTGMVPFKWMALESIIDSVYTEKSDVWSFGVLLWELFTLGGTPYPGMSVNEVHQSLLEGKRMKPPNHCPQEICNVMSRCWAKNPEERPDFSSLNETFSAILGFKPMSQVSEFLDEVTNDSQNESIRFGFIKSDVENEIDTLLSVA